MIRGQAITLRAMEPSDVEYLYQIENNPENWRISQTVKPFSKHTLEQFARSTQDIHEHQQIRWIIIEKDSQMPIGTIDFFDFDAINKRAGLGILISDIQMRGRGYAKEALQLSITYAFDHLLLNSLYCNILEDNTPSITLFSQLGFDKIGLKKDWIYTKEGFKNEWLFQKIKSI